MTVIQANELRVGNYIWNTHGHLQKITAQDILDLNNYSNFAPERCQYFTPLQLDEIWLIEFDAEYRLINNSIPEYSIICTPENYKKEYRLVFRFGESKNKLFNMYWYPFKESGDMHVFPCEYVHQLQNIYFTLKQTELIIKDK